MNSILIFSLFSLPTLLLFLTHLPKSQLRNQYRYAKSSMYLAVILGATSMVWVTQSGTLNLNPFESEFSLVIRLDPLSTLIYTMIAIIGLVVVRYSRNYLDGDSGHAQFISQLALTIAFVQLLVVSGNLTTFFIAWIGTSFGLHKLLLFYPERKKARLAARKKFIIARVGDVTLLSAFVLIYLSFRTSDLTEILNRLDAFSNAAIPVQLEIAGILLVVTACLKSVQIPFHSWLLEVMETPTPVSALLHAGLLNAGPFLILRFSNLIDLTTAAPIVLIIAGALSALFGAISASAQPAVKTALAYSSIAHMGFTLFICGLGVYSASLLHLVAHSFYKAHAFLSSGSLIEKVQTSGAINYFRTYNYKRIFGGLAMASIVYLTVSYLWFNSISPEIQLLLISSIIFLGIISIYINALDSTNSFRAIVYLIGASILIINCFYGFEHLFSIYLDKEVPGIRILNQSTSWLLMVILLLFTLTIFAQALMKSSSTSTRYRKLHIHFRNGLYLNQILNRSMNTLSINPNKQRYK